MKLLRILARLIWISCALFAACIAGAAVVAIAVFNMAPLERWLSGDPVEAGINVALAGIIIIFFVASFTLVPAAIAIIVGEIFRLRSWLYYAAAGALTAGLTLVLQQGRSGIIAPEVPPPAALDSWQLLVFVAAGLAGGLVYWALAGRSAGNVFAPRLTREEAHRDGPSA